MSDHDDALARLLQPVEPERPPRRPWALIGGLLVVVAVVAGVVLWMTRDDSSSASSSTTAPVVVAGDGTATTAPPEGSTSVPETTTTSGAIDLTGPLPDFEEVAFPVGEIELRGRLFAGGPTAVVLSHSFDTGQGAIWDMSQLMAMAEGFTELGYTTLIFDHAGHGASPGEQSVDTLGPSIAAATRWLYDQGAERVVVAAWGVTGSAAIEEAAAGRMEVMALVTPFARPQFRGIDAQAAAADLDVPTLFVTLVTGRTTRWAQLIQGAAEEGVIEYVEFASPPTGSDPAVTFFPQVLEVVHEFIESVGG